ncbi:MAG: ATP-dependent protease, partial [Thermoleophilaceae bacterium]
MSRNAIERRLAVDGELLTRKCDPAALAFASTADVEPLVGAIGQPRALWALEFALGVGTSGYNVFAAGPVGTGKRSTIERHLADYASRRETAADWVYLFDFADEQRPRA